MAETPEIYGAEHMLTRRAISPEVGKKLVDRILWWEDYVTRNKGSLNNNPSPGNKAGGLTTILEKSLGAAAKGGTTPLNDVLLYAQKAEKKGFLFMDSPGYDPASVTGQIASGCNVVTFTTGRGSCFGCKPSPSIKIATNTEMYNNMVEDMDVNAGTVITDNKSIEDVGQEIFDLIVKVASGEKSKSEFQGLGDLEFVSVDIHIITMKANNISNFLYETLKKDINLIKEAFNKVLDCKHDISLLRGKELIKERSTEVKEVDKEHPLFMDVLEKFDGEYGLKPQTNLFGTTFYTLTGFHGAHVTLGVVWLLSLLLLSFKKGVITKEKNLDVDLAALYWHFVDVVWIVIFTVVYLFGVFPFS